MKISPRLLFLGLILLSACAFSKLSIVEYNNRLVEQVNLSSTAIEITATLYNDIIPDVVTEQDEIKTNEMSNAFSTAQKEINQSKTLTDILSRNEEQQLASNESIDIYISAADLYLIAYEEMLTYYSSETYKEDISQVQTLDETLHTHYTTFIEANNDLVEVLEGFVDKE